MPPTSDELGGRLPLLPAESLDASQRRFYDAAMAEQYPWSTSVGFRFVTTDCRLLGPHNAFLRRPDVFEKFQVFASAASQSLSPQLREVVILAVGSAWSSAYEVYAHRMVAGAAGISSGDVDAMAAGHPPEDLGADAALAFTLAQQLVVDHHVEQRLYDAALATFGEQGLVAIAALVGTYLTVSGVLNLFEVPAPDEPETARGS